MSKVESASVKLLIKILLLVAGYILLAAVSGSFDPPALVLALISVVSYLRFAFWVGAFTTEGCCQVDGARGLSGSYSSQFPGLIGMLTGVVDESR
jgi:hypothetical protein